MQTSDSYTANSLLEYSSSGRWTVTDGPDRFTKRAALFSDPHRAPLIAFEFETRPPPETPSEGQLFFLPTTAANAYLLGWYVCPKAGPEHAHLFGLVSARALFDGINRNTVHQAPERLVARMLKDTLPLTANAPYDDAYLYQAVQRVKHADQLSLRERSIEEYDAQRELQIAKQRARTVDEYSGARKRGAAVDELADVMSEMGVGSADPMTGLWAARPRRFVRARRPPSGHQLSMVREGPESDI
jgi:hypothetical protein